MDVPMLDGNEWENIKQLNSKMNQEFNTVDPSVLSSKWLPLNSDGSLNVFWYDAHYEEYNNSDGTVILFGKAFDHLTKKYVSVSIQVKEIERIMYAVPKDPTSECWEV